MPNQVANTGVHSFPRGKSAPLGASNPSNIVKYLSRNLLFQCITAGLLEMREMDTCVNLLMNMIRPRKASEAGKSLICQMKIPAAVVCDLPLGKRHKVLNAKP